MVDGGNWGADLGAEPQKVSGHHVTNYSAMAAVKFKSGRNMAGLMQKHDGRNYAQNLGASVSKDAPSLHTMATAAEDAGDQYFRSEQRKRQLSATTKAVRTSLQIRYANISCVLHYICTRMFTM